MKSKPYNSEQRFALLAYLGSRQVVMIERSSKVDLLIWWRDAVRFHPDWAFVITSSGN